MKTIKKLLFLSLFLLVFSSCQEEISEITQAPEGEVLQANTNVANLVQRTTTKDGSKDNIIDNASCLSVQLPVTVSVNGLEIIVDSEADFEVIEAIFDEFDDDIDDLDIIFPIVIILSDFTEITINNFDELENFIAECEGENEMDDDIECVDFVYPITLSIFDSANQLAETITIQSDEHFYKFIDEIEGHHIVQVNFPITVVLFDGTEKVITDLEMLEDVMENVKDLCDEDDDNDFDDDDCMHCTKDQTTQLLLECSWNVDKLIINDQDNTEQFENFKFTFLEEGTVIAESGGNEFTGTWELTEPDHMGMGSNSQHGIFVNINFEDLPDLSFNWMLHEIEDNNTIDFRIVHNRLRIEQNCDTNNDNNDDTCFEISEEALSSLLVSCNWSVNKIINDGVDNTEQFSNFTFTFFEDKRLEAESGGNIINGTWNIGFFENCMDVKMNFENFPQFSLDWRLHLIENGMEMEFKFGEDELKLIKTCNEDKTNLMNILNEGSWVVARFIDKGVTKTSNYTDFALDFKEDFTVTATKGNDVVDGTWMVRFDSGKLKLDLDFGETIPFDEFNEDWLTVDITNTRVEVNNLDDSGNEESNLVFERL